MGKLGKQEDQAGEAIGIEGSHLLTTNLVVSQHLGGILMIEAIGDGSINARFWLWCMAVHKC